MLLVVAGCATQAQKDADRIAAGIEATYASAAQCLSKVRTQPGFLRLNDKGLWNEPHTLTQLVDEAHTSLAEKQAIVRYYESIQPCRDLLFDGLLKSAPAYVPIYATMIARTDGLYADLVVERTAWGEANKALDEIWNWTGRELQHAADQLNRDLVNRHQFELQQRQASAEAVALINAHILQRTSFCTVVGSTVACN